MKNKIYLHNIPQDAIDTRFAEVYYDIFFTSGEIEDYIYLTSQGIIVFDEFNELKGKSFPYYKDIPLINSKDLDIFKVPENFLAYLDKYFGRDRLINPKQFEIVVGSVVKSKVQPNLGVGLVKEVKEDGFFQISFPKAGDQLTKPYTICHKSTLRVVSHIKEVINDDKETA